MLFGAPKPFDAAAKSEIRCGNNLKRNFEKLQKITARRSWTLSRLGGFLLMIDEKLAAVRGRPQSDCGREGKFGGVGLAGIPENQARLHLGSPESFRFRRAVGARAASEWWNWGVTLDFEGWLVQMVLPIKLIPQSASIIGGKFAPRGCSG